MKPTKNRNLRGTVSMGVTSVLILIVIAILFVAIYVVMQGIKNKN
jgi:uncharacterized protein (UPF0333 family)